MPFIEVANPISGSASASPFAGVPGAGTNEVQTLTIGGTPTAGSFTITFAGMTTAAIAWNATNATLLASMVTALDALATTGGAGGIVPTAGTLTAGIGTILLTFSGANVAKRVQPLAVANSSLTGTAPTAVIAETTPGVTAAGIGAAKGALLTDTTNGKLYINTGTAAAPTWTVVGTQT